MVEIYYVEDDPDIAGSVRDYLDARGYRVSLFGSVATARQAVLERPPGLMLIDKSLPDGDGDALCRWVRQRHGDRLPIVFLTVRGETEDVVGGFADGADDYVVKPFALAVLHARIGALLRRADTAGEARLYCDDLVLDREGACVYLGREAIALSRPQYLLLLTLMENKGRTVTRGRLLEQLWDSEGNYVNDNTLTVTMKRLREKLRQPRCIRTVRSFGYRMEDTQ